MGEIKNENLESQKISEIKNNPDKISQLIDNLGLNNYSQELLELYNSLDKIKKQELIKEIEDNESLLSLDSSKILEIISPYKNQYISEKKEEEKEKKEEEKEKKEEEKEKKEEEINIDEKEKLKLAQQRLDAFYKNTGFKDKSEFLKSNPELEKLYNQEVKTKKIEEGSEEDTRVLLGVILNNRSNIKTSTGEKLDDKIFEELKSSARSLGVEYKDKFPCLPDGNIQRTREMIVEGGFSGTDFKGDVMVKGDKIFYEDNSGVRQTWNTGEVPPVKYLEQDGIKIESKVRCESKYGYMVQRENLEIDIKNLENSITDKQQKIKSQYFTEFNVNNSLMTFGEQYNLLLENIDKHYDDKINKEKQEGGNEKDIEALEVIKKNRKAEVERIAGEIRDEYDTYKAKKEELKELLKKEANRIPDYKKSMLESDENIKQNLSYLKSLHLDIFGRNTDEFISLINQHKGSLGFAGAKDIDLSNKLTSEDKNLIIKTMIKILGEDSEKLFNLAEYRMLDNDNTTNEKIKDRLVKSGALGENRIDININNIKGILEKSNKQ